MLAKEATMLTSRKYDDWSLQEHKDRDYKTDIERKFFGAVENPKPATEELKDVYRAYGKYVSA